MKPSLDKLILGLFLFGLVYFFMPQPVKAIVETGVQVPSSNAVTRLSSSGYSYKWIKFQYELGGDQPIATWINAAKQNGYKVLISVAKNHVGIPALVNPPTKPCPYEEELELIPVEWDRQGNPTRYEKEPMPDNAYTRFRDQMTQVIQKIGNADAIEIWNEPNLNTEWTDQGLGSIDPVKFATFTNCGAKGIKKSNYSGKLISAALAPLSGNYDDLRFFSEFVSAGGLNSVDGIGWHGNVTANIPPWDTNEQGFQRVRNAFGKGKPIWMTEFGWARDRAGISRETQSLYVSEAFLASLGMPDIQTMIVWNFGFAREHQGDPGEFTQWDIEGLEIPKVRVPRSSTPTPGGPTPVPGSGGGSCSNSCIYSQIDSDGATRCYQGACLDPSKPCTTNNNCGWVDGCSNPISVSCSGDIPKEKLGAGCYQCVCLVGNTPSRFAVKSPTECTKSFCQSRGVQNGRPYMAVPYPGCREDCTDTCTNDSTGTKGCPPDRQSLPTNNNYPRSEAVNAPTSGDDSQIVEVLSNSSLPPEISNQNTSGTTQSARVQVDVKKSFFDTIAEFLIRLAGLGFCQSAGFCKPNLELGQQTENFTSGTKSLGQATIPDDVLLIPEINDCHLQSNSPGNTKLDETSSYLGTNTGLYSINLPEFNQTREKIDERQEQQNININQQLFKNARQIPDIDVRQDNFYNAYFPEGIKPFKATDL